MRIVGLGRGLFALAAAGLAVLSFTYHDFAPMWQSVPVWIAGRESWVYGCGMLLLAAGAGLCFARTALPSALTIGAYQAVWAMISIFRILSEPLSVGAWYGFSEALTSLVGVWILYVILRWQSRGSQMPIAIERAVRAAQVLFGLSCIFYGWSHFAYADYTASMVPTWLPSRMGFAYFTGLGHIAAGIGIIAGFLPRLAATLEAIMMSLFGLLVWAPSLLAKLPPEWATPPKNQWSEIVVNLLLAASAWIVAASLRNRPWGFAAGHADKPNQSRPSRSPM
jgi:uncharacterized membrane protein YphA (DoxX/SURF4 family)